LPAFYHNQIVVCCSFAGIVAAAGWYAIGKRFAMDGPEKPAFNSVLAMDLIGLAHWWLQLCSVLIVLACALAMYWTGVKDFGLSRAALRQW